MSQANELDRILSGMGKTADEVANTLRASKTQGVRNTVRFLNPVVRYGLAHLHLDIFSLHLTPNGKMRIIVPDTDPEECALSPAIVAFLESFNRGEYPDLELPRPPKT